MPIESADLPLDLAPEVAAARAEGAPVVALESTLITHGLPRPLNRETAAALEDAVRTAGAVPATIAVLDGRIRVGLDAAALDRLAAEPVAKLSRADLAATLARGGSGGTTVAATIIAAHLAGIAVFATGGIGGVHRGAGESFDVSADLHELARTPVTVIASGAKALLDLPATLEVLETLGVPVIAHGQDGFAAFWSRESGLAAPLRMDDPAEIAAAHHMRARLGIIGGQLVCNPIPAEAEIPRATMEPMIAEAVAAARADGITGKAVTPAILERLRDISEGATLDANLALLHHNARTGAVIARAVAAQSGRVAGAPGPA